MASKYQENGNGDTEKPLIVKHDADQTAHKEELVMVYLSTAVAVCGSYAFGTCVGYSSPTQFSIMDELNLSYSQAMRLSSVICSAGWLAIYLAKEPMVLYLGRVLSGYSIGIISYVVPMFVGEISPNKLRGALSSTNQLSIVIGLSAVYVIGAFVGWRILALLGVVPCGLLFLGLFFIPESPRWLAMNGEEEEFEAALRKLRGKHADISYERSTIQEYLTILQTLPKVTFVNLFDRSNYRAVIISVGLMAFQQFVGINGIVFYSTEIFKSAGFNPSLGTILFGILQVGVTAGGALLIDRTGRRPLLMMSASGLLLGNLLIAFSFFFKAHSVALTLVPNLAILGVLVYIAFFSIGMGAGPWLIMSEVFPLHVKGLGGGLVTLMNWFGSWVISYTFNFLMLWSSHGTFFLYAFVCLLATIFIYKMIPETKGRRLEEIHASLNS
ncbi:sugar transporter ERD6-like 8 isoform X3 [Nicotiana tomentosiformis]|uniref:sugar transporter ERD6-like 8 isoform X3 n=1 Tax=Nicotiana tomentosiformis TaxID=4098 RepID=UPI00388CCB8A